MKCYSEVHTASMRNTLTLPEMIGLCARIADSFQQEIGLETRWPLTARRPIRFVRFSRKRTNQPFRGKILPARPHGNTLPALRAAAATQKIPGNQQPGSGKKSPGTRLETLTGPNPATCLQHPGHPLLYHCPPPHAGSGPGTLSGWIQPQRRVCSTMLFLPAGKVLGRLDDPKAQPTPPSLPASRSSIV